MRQPKLITSARGQTYVQLGVAAYIHNLDLSAFARRYLRNHADILFRMDLQRDPSEQEVSVSFSLFLRVLRCFTSPRSLHPAYIFSWRSPMLHRGGFPIRTRQDHRLLATFPSLSLAAASFIGSLLPSHPPYALTCFGHPDRHSPLAHRFVACSGAPST